MKPNKVSGEDMIFLIEAVFAVSSGIGTPESRKDFLSNKHKVKRLVEVQSKYDTNTINQTLDQIKTLVFSQE